MLKRFDVGIKSNPVCNKPIFDIVADEFQYYDKDGFELNLAEQKYYHLMGYPIDTPILNHTCWQEPWFALEESNKGLILDHCIILHRCSYEDAASYQLEKIKNNVPSADFLLKTKQKWGFDFALDAVDDQGNIFEVLHIEVDSYDYDQFIKKMINFDYIVRHTNWYDASQKISARRKDWEGLNGFEQNNWKANYLLGWHKAEYTEKASA